MTCILHIIPTVSAKQLGKIVRATSKIRCFFEYHSAHIISIMSKRNCTIGKTSFRDDHRSFCIEDKNRLMHLFILGQTGTGKTTLLESMIKQDVAKGNGAIIFDPHGDLSKSLEKWTSKNHYKTDFLNIADGNSLIGYNPIRHVNLKLRPLLASGLIAVFAKLWSDT